ncbi:SbcC/MukB-like Walker B domain-containing protein, partial [Streptomyces spectabilis]|uniref:SbcC/MukB-like Walker B domain-containing protein n=1 Tax=Streptomyces spectabilis TaxID=68270 RepID=UPI0033CCA991
RSAAEAADALTHATDRLRRHLAHPALACALRTDAEALRLPDDAPAHDIARAVTALPGHLVATGHTADTTAVLRAQSVLERALSGMFDIVSSVDGDQIHIVEVHDAEGRRHIGQAALHLAQLRDRGRLTLTEREHQTFKDFVVSGLAQSLAHHVDQATQLVEAMNDSLGSISTSHGIGVSVAWELTDNNGPEKDIVKLARLSPAVMTQDQAEELTALLRSLVETEFAKNPTDGYTTHLRTALDYRQWHTMQIIVTGPEPRRRRVLSSQTRRRVKLSQGEIRFVSYVALFAAVDAYLSGRSDHDRALRLLLLDDAFAKVDTPTVGELLALLVRLDIDFVMTGHALWGFFPTVPSLDTYEVRRAEGKAAVTRHIHWDGHHRHVKAGT